LNQVFPSNSRKLLATAGILLLVLVTACQAAGKNPDNIEIPVIAPTPDESLCLNEQHPPDAPHLNEVSSDQLVGDPAGIKIFDRVVGEGTSPTIEDMVTVNYTGWLAGGCVFDSTYARGNSAELLLIGLIPGWRQAMLDMAPGGIRRVEIPPALAYRELGSPPVIPPNATLTFEIELISVLTPAQASATATVIASSATPTPTPTATPEGGVSVPDCDNPGYPDSAPQYGDVQESQLVSQHSGISVFDVKVGDGAQPQQGDSVNVQYTGWLTDGCVFDSSYSRGAAATFPVGGVIPGFRDAILGMQVGGQRRVMIPPDQGYGAAGAGAAIPPNATLVFDIVLEGVQ